MRVVRSVASTQASYQKKAEEMFLTLNTTTRVPSSDGIGGEERPSETRTVFDVELCGVLPLSPGGRAASAWPGSCLTEREREMSPTADVRSITGQSSLLSTASTRKKY